MKDIKVHVPTPEISKLVQEKLFEKGCSWFSGRSGSYLFVGSTKNITYSCNHEIFTNDDKLQVHYLQILADDFEGQLFKYCDDPDGFVYYFGSDGYVHWVDEYGAYDNIKWDELFAKYKHLYIFCDVNEEEIVSNDMPKLEAGKHVLVTGGGDKYLYLTGDVCVRIIGEYWSEMKGVSWDTLDDTLKNNIVKVYELKPYDLSSNIKLDSKYCPLVWEREGSDKKKLRDEYAELQQQIQQLQGKAKEIEEKL